MKPITIRIILIIALYIKWEISQLDVNNAFLNGNLKEDVFMQQPKGYENEANSRLVCKLHKAIYGLKQLPCVGNEKFKSTLVELGFVPTKSDTIVGAIIITGSDNNYYK